MKRLFILSLIVISTLRTASAQGDAEYKAAFKKFFELSGSQNTFKTMVPQLIAMFKQQKSGVPDAFWQEFEADAIKSTDNLIDLMAPIYQKHLTLADLKKIIEFYESPAGKKLAEKTPLISQESMAAGQQWGMQLGQKMMQKLQANGY